MNLQTINASASPEVQMNENFGALDWAAVYAMDARTTTGVTWGYLGGRWGGFAVTTSTLTLNAAASNYVVVAVADGAITTSTSTTNWNDASNYRRVYLVTTVGGAVTAIEDHRAGPNGIHG
jgi:sugar lactone lactonase YvrE